MAEGLVLISHQFSKPIKVLKWKVREGSVISIGCVMLLFDYDGSTEAEQRKLKSTQAGTVHRLIAQEGAIVKRGDVLFELSPCIHPTVINDMCAECGADLRKDDLTTTASIPMVHSIPELKVNEELAQKLGKADGERLLRDRKLVLLVDLDQTIIHTTNDNIPPNIRDVYHFQLYGPGSPWYHTRLRPGTHTFLNNVSSMYELHICTFGARNYAHTITMLIDRDQRYFSNRILSRDECFDPTSKKANLKALFPCGDNMVCIIDDREDVWSHASNLIHVKPYHFFQHTGDINAPPGLDKHENDDKEGVDLMKVKTKHKNNKSVNREKINNVNEVDKTDNINEVDKVNIVNEVDKGDNIKEATKAENAKKVAIVNEVDEADNTNNVDKTDKVNEDVEKKGNNKDLEKKDNNEDTQNKGNNEDLEKKDHNEDTEKKDNNEDTEKKDNNEDTEKKDNNEDTEKKGNKEEVEKKDSITENNKKEPEEQVNENSKNEEEKTKENGKLENKNELTEEMKVVPDNNESQNVVEKKHDKVNRIAEKKVENMIVDDTTKKIEDEFLDVEDPDDYLLYLEDILKKIHAEFYKEYDKLESGQVPDLKQVIPNVRAHVLSGCNLVFSGLVPTHIKLINSKAYQVARSLGANITQDLQEDTTHLVAVRPGTAKVNAGRRRKNVKIVTPDWLWTCAERWEHVSEVIYPLNRRGSKNRHPPPHCSSPEHVPNYPVHDSPAMRKRTPSGRFMDTINPLMSFSSDDIADMDKEVEDMLDDDSESDDEAKRKPTLRQEVEITRKMEEDNSSSSEESLTGEYPRGFKRSRSSHKKDGAIDTEDVESSLDEFPSTKFRRGEKLDSDLDIGDSNSEGSIDPPDEIEDGEWNMMGAALEREFLSNS
ncbi:NLI interacting factor-like phosphatase [Popillia japonica]|uniref:RNA polymerase II subunit A C-terminal domain phosphatase n=1 Tax=Popillia japonica TaxID=7064 RepID=A0AAW1LT24_POPJA